MKTKVKETLGKIKRGSPDEKKGRKLSKTLNAIKKGTLNEKTRKPAK